MSQFFLIFSLLDSDNEGKVGEIPLDCQAGRRDFMKKGDFDWGNLVHWARLDLGLPLDADYSISEERARELMAQIAAAEDKDRPLMELVAAYGNQIRRILAAHVKDAGEMENAEQEFWTTVVQNAGKYVKARPVKRWLSVIAKRQAIAAYRRLHQRMKRVLFRAEMVAKMRDDGEQDDLDLESLADESIAALRSITTGRGDGTGRSGSGGASVGSVFGAVRGSRNEVNLSPLHRGRILRANGGGRAYHLLQYARASLPRPRFHEADSHRCVSGSLKESKDLGFCGGRLEGDEGGDEVDKSHEGAGEFVVASGDAPKLFDAAKESLHFLTHSIFLFVVRKEHFPV